MGYLIGIVCSIILAGIIAILWVNCIDDIKENHPNYRGQDLFDEDEDYLG